MLWAWRYVVWHILKGKWLEGTITYENYAYLDNVFVFLWLQGEGRVWDGAEEESEESHQVHGAAGQEQEDSQSQCHSFQILKNLTNIENIHQWIIHLWNCCYSFDNQRSLKIIKIYRFISTILSVALHRYAEIFTYSQTSRTGAYHLPVFLSKNKINSD